MKNILIILSFLGTMYLKAYSQKDNGFELHGNINGLKDGSLVCLSKGEDTIAKTLSHGSKFILKGYIKGEANYYFLKVDTTFNKVGKKIPSNALWLVNSKLLVTGDLKNWSHLNLTGSEAQDEFNEVMKIAKGAIPQLEKISWYQRFIEEHSNSLYVSDLIMKMFGNDEKLYNSLADRAKNSYWGKELYKGILQNKKYNLISSTGKIPNFKITNTEGKEVQILDLVARQRYTLIDFWASWCGPCRKAIPEMKRVYKSFHSKGFNIVGVSTDKKEIDWKKALNEDETPWTHGQDNIENASKKIFDLAAIPGYILIDQEGKIIQMDIFRNSGVGNKIKLPGDKSLGSDLYEIIETLLKEEKSK